MALSVPETMEANTTRRSLLSGAAASIVAACAVDGKFGAGEADPAILLWRDWLAAHRLCSEACRRQQKLETEMLRLCGRFPAARVAFAEDICFESTSFCSEVDRAMSPPDQQAMPETAKAEFAAFHADWTAADAQLGYSRAKAIEDELVEVEASLAEDLWRTEPRSIAGVAAKLHCVLETEDPSCGLEEDPWPQLRIILADLLRMDGIARPAQLKLATL